MMNKHPDPQMHLNVSLLKSGLRIVGYIWLAVVIGTPGAAIAGAILVVSEGLGIIEELV